ncbi:hypothetical protein B0T10DRAFT_590612 [Thelonectria olida]|uniref:chitinase n=1 Tax=Thelonectria olida TaxID=1576542 RepID=A0A9P9AF63_9HYPO|nr:hypothetical protein B0T10DRAFT_590612 [Thelonectria olida]
MHMRTWLLCLLLLCLCVAAATDDDTTCSATKRCKKGCCNKSGNCGFGPDFCGTNCRSDCDRKSECNPGFGAKWSEVDKCPLNVCCSKHGYCGTTKDFCGSKKVTRPSCGKDSGVTRVVGYFEGWARNRPCETFWPEQIPIGLYTHINFAFATINPLTFLVRADEDADINTYKRLMALKKKDPDLKVYLAIGGWTFNDPGATATTFSDLAASVPRQKKFMSSLMSFMSTHSFDGLDLDWEYPQAKDRSGRDADFANFPKFMASLKKMMDAGNKGLSITLPASYWYLKHFDIKKLEKSVDFFNIMSYDLHGAWDQKVEWTEPYLNAHTNLTEIDLALDLLWRNDIEYDKVVLGLGFYGRAFTAASASCMKPGCLFSDSGVAGKCSREKGILLNSEIDALIKEHNVKPELHKEEAVKIAKWGKQWVSFDDEETFKLKTEFAQSRCLGGVMVWAISHDTKDAKYNKALAKALGRKVTSGSLDDDEQASEINKIPNKQCRWTNCKEDCPQGWVNVARSDKGARKKKDEKMWDETGCGDDGHHSFCCPGTEELPTCGWYGFSKGKCGKGSCPSNMVEIGSNQMYCHKKQNYQSACCTTDVKSMKLYSTCEWGAYPDCDSQDKCPNTAGDSSKNYLWAESSTGTGGGQCDDKKNNLGLKVPGMQTRKFCCDVHNANLRFTDCQWFKDVGPAPATEPNGFCRSGCPSDRVRVALDTEAAVCRSGGMARCCKTRFNDEFEVENPKLDGYRSAMKAWIDDPTCPNPSSILSRRSHPLLGDVVANASLSMELASRDDIKIQDITAQLLLTYLIARIGSENMLEKMGNIWDSYIENNFPSLTIRSIKAFLGMTPQWETDGPEVTARRILCSPHSYNARVASIQGTNGGGSATWIDCIYVVCDKNGVCGDEQDEVTRRRRALLPCRSAHLSAHRHHWLHVRQISKPQEWMVVVKSPDGKTATIEYEVPANDPPAGLDQSLSSLQNTAEFETPGDCSDWRLKHGGGVWNAGRKGFHTEHPIDKSVMKQFFTDAALGTLRSGSKPLYGPVPIEFFEEILVLGADDAWWPEIPGNPDYDDGNLFSRLMECLGSQTNDMNFAVAVQDINWVKGKLMQLQNPIADNKWEEKVQDNIDYVLGILRASVATFSYMNSDDSPGPNVFNKVSNVINDMLLQLLHAENLFERKHGDIQVAINQFFLEWLRDYYGAVTTKAQAFLRGVISKVKANWGPRTGEKAKQVMEIIGSLEPQIANLRIRTDWDISVLDDDDPMDEDTDMSK